MRVAAIKDNFSGCPSDIQALGFSGASRVGITIGKEYEVCAIVMWRGVLFAQVVDDTRLPAWLPTWLFEVREPALPPDWICNLFGGEVQMVLGPDFIARDEDAYSRMVELDPSSVQLFWRRVKQLSD
jgi:hypothetical protein